MPVAVTIVAIVAVVDADGTGDCGGSGGFADDDANHTIGVCFQYMINGIGKLAVSR